MKVAYDAGPLLDPPTGVGRYTRELADALELSGIELQRYAVAFGGRSDPSIRRLKVPARLVRASWRRFEAPSIRRLTGPVDLVHGTNFVLPPVGDVPGVVTVHDLSFFRDDVFPGGEALRELVPWSVERAARILVPTKVIADELCERFGVAPERVIATYEGVGPVFFGASPLADTVLGRMGIPGRFIVAVGTIEPRKNLPRLLEAWKGLRAELRGWTLVLAGPKGWGPSLPETPGVVLTGWVGDETLPGLLAAADVFCYPSLYEGFGLPPLEAMAAGTPAVVGRYGAAEEVLGDAALLVTPTDADALAEGLYRAATDGSVRSRLTIAGRARAAGYSWTRCAGATISAYREATGQEAAG